MLISFLEAKDNQEIFFKIIGDKIINSKDIRELVDENTELSPLITQIFDVYGMRVPYPFTVFEGIYRYDPKNPTNIIFDGKKVYLEDNKKLNNIDNDWSLNEYYETLHNAIKCETKYAIVMLSSGWDSSSILASLSEQMPKENIKGFTLQLNYGGDTPVNIFELKKAKLICQHHGIENIVIPSNFLGDLNDYMKGSSHKMLFALTALNHQTLWEAIEEKGFKDNETTVYAGEYSDGAHNFGFAQHFGAIYPEKGFRQYGDKIRNYFLSPNFLNRLKKGENLDEDILVKNFAPSKLINYKGWNESELMIDLVKEIFVNDSRGPFEKKSITKKEIKERAIIKFKEVILDSEKPDSFDQWYSLLMRIYHCCHWSGSTVKGIELHNPGVYKVNMPFGNIDLLELLEKMPTKFGRGLEPLPTKYPLRKYCELKLQNYPLDLQEGMHAYLYDADQSFCIMKHLYENTSLSDLLIKSWDIDRYSVRKTFLDEENYELINKEIHSRKSEAKECTIVHATSFHMIDQLLDYSGYKKK